MSHEDSKEPQANEELKMGRRRLLRRGGFLAGLTAVATTFSLTPFTPAHAATFSTQSNSPQISELGTDEAQKYILAAVNSPDYQHFKQQTLSNGVTNFSFQEQKASVWSITTPQSTSIAARIPIKGGADGSFYVAQFSLGSTAIVGTQSALLSHTSGGNVYAVAEVNGQQILDVTITPKGKFVSGTTTINGKTVTLGQQNTQMLSQVVRPAAGRMTSLCCLEYGLITFGFASVPLILVAALICAAVCAVTLGGGCLPCIGVVIGVGYGAFLFLEGSCDSNPNRWWTQGIGGSFSCPL